MAGPIRKVDSWFDRAPRRVLRMGPPAVSEPLVQLPGPGIRGDQLTQSLLSGGRTGAAMPLPTKTRVTVTVYEIGVRAYDFL
jgi:hypothetical protein